MSSPATSKIHDWTPARQTTLADKLQKKWLPRWLPEEWPRIMSQDSALAKGVWLPRWFLAAVLGALLPLFVIGLVGVGGIMFTMHENQVRSEERALSGQQLQTQTIQGLKDTLEYRLKNMETQGKLNDEHTRQLENRVSRVEERRGIRAPPDPAQ